MKTFNKLSLFFSLFTVVMFSSCSWGNRVNIVPPLASNPETSNKNGIAELSIKLEGECAARMVENPTLDLSKLSFVLEGETGDHSKKVHEEFSYNSEVKIYVYFGKWDFTLTAYKLDDKNKTVVLKGALNDFVVNESTKKLVFDMEYGDAKGGLNYSVTYPSDEYTTLTVEVYKKPSGMYTNVSSDDLLYSYYFCESEEMLEFFYPEEGVPNTSEIVESEEGEATAVLNLSNILSPGYYTLLCKVENYVCDPYDEDKLKGPAASSKYEATVPVIPGEVTSGSIPFTEINRMFNITYDVDESLGFEYNPELYSSTFIKYHRIYIPAVDSPTFGGWYYEKGTEKVELPLIEEGDYEGLYLLNEDYSLSENVELKAKVLKGNGEINIFDPSTILINGPEVIEYENNDIKYSTVQFKNANYVWYWDGEEVENEFGHTCVINTSKLKNDDSVVHTLKVEIEYNGVWADSTREIRTLPDLSVLYNATGMPVWNLNDNSGAYSEAYRKGLPDSGGGRQLYSYCFDSENSFYTVTRSVTEYKTDPDYILTLSNEYEIKKYQFNVFDGFSDPEVIASFPCTFNKTNEVFISRIVSDGTNVYFVTRTNVKEEFEGEVFDLHSPFSINFDSEKDLNNLYMVSPGNTTPVPVDVSSDYKVVTAVAYENGFLYVAGYDNNVRVSEQNYVLDKGPDDPQETVTVSVSDTLYQIRKYPVNSGVINNSVSEVVLAYYDSDIVGSNPLETAGHALEAQGSAFDGSLNAVAKVNNDITDLVVKNDSIFALRAQSLSVEGNQWYTEYSFTVLYKDAGNSDFAVRNLKPLCEVDANGELSEKSITPVRINAVRRKELEFGTRENWDSGLIISIDLSENDSTLLLKRGIYGFIFDEVSQGSGLDVELRPYKAGSYEYN